MLDRKHVVAVEPLKVTSIGPDMSSEKRVLYVEWRDFLAFCFLLGFLVKNSEKYFAKFEVMKLDTRCPCVPMEEVR